MFKIFTTNLMLHEFLHFIVAMIVAFFLFRKYKIRKLILVVFLVSFFVDLDHLTEGFLIYGFNLSWITYFPGNNFREFWNTR